MLALPTLIDRRYRIDRHVGRGGFGDVYAGVHLVLGAPVAVKVLDLHRQPDPARCADLAGRFLDEGRVLTRLRHPNIVAALDLGLLSREGDETPAPYLVMEWVEGTTLQHALAARGSGLPLSEAWPFFETLLEAIAYAHAEGVVHRDLKPANVMVSGEDPLGAPHVIDFGIAKWMSPDAEAGSGTTETAQPANAFTPGYAAPEQIAQARTGPWTDVHALALIFVELLTGETPYGASANARLAAIDPERPTPRARGVDVGALEPVIARALALRPRDRFAHAGEMLEAARDAARDLPRRASAALPLATRSREPPPAAPVSIAAAGRTEPTETPVRRATADPSAGLGTTAAPIRSRRALFVGAAIVLTAAAAAVLALARVDEPPPSSPASAPSAAAPGQVLRVGGVDWRVQEGAWHLEGDALVGSFGQVYTTETFADATLEVDFEDVAARKTRNTVGIGFHAQLADHPADGSSYGANFHALDGTYNVFEGTSGDWVPIDPAFPGFHASPAIHSEGKNHVVVRASGSTYTVEVNGTTLSTFDDATYPRGRFTLWVESRTQIVRFSGIRLTGG